MIRKSREKITKHHSNTFSKTKPYKILNNNLSAKAQLIFEFFGSLKIICTKTIRLLYFINYGKTCVIVQTQG